MLVGSDRCTVCSWPRWVAQVAGCQGRYQISHLQRTSSFTIKFNYAHTSRSHCLPIRFGIIRVLSCVLWRVVFSSLYTVPTYHLPSILLSNYVLSYLHCTMQSQMLLNNAPRDIRLPYYLFMYVFFFFCSISLEEFHHLFFSLPPFGFAFIYPLFIAFFSPSLSAWWYFLSLIIVTVILRYTYCVVLCFHIAVLPTWNSTDYL